MKIRIAKDLYVNSNTLVRLEWRRFYPVLVVHEKFEKILKWILRIIAIGGIATSVISIPVWYLSLGLAIIIALIEQFFERSIFEYTTMIVQPFPGFEIDYGQWKTNGFMLPKEKNDEDLAYFGPSYQDETYAINMFKYFKSWIDDSRNDDKDNNLIVSLIIEPNEEYTTYIYANIGRKRLDTMFKVLGDMSKLEKHGKRQQQFITQMFYWNTLDFKEGYYIKKFLEFQKPDESFYFLPSVIQPFGLPPEFLFDYAIKKYEFKLKKREDVKKFEPEYLFNPENEKKGKEKPATPVIQKDIFYDIEKVLSNNEDIGFTPNEGKSAGAIQLCFSDPYLPFIAYKELIEKKGGKDIIIKIHELPDHIVLNIYIENHHKEINIKSSRFNKAQLDLFRDVKGGGPAVVFLIGYPPSSERKIVMENGISPLVVKWEFLK